MPEIINTNKVREWERFAVKTASKIKVGILGYGGMGKSAAKTLSYLGYDISVWAKKERKIDDINYFYGTSNINKFAKGQDVIICMLPLTKETENILNLDLISNMNKGGCLINVGRGKHLVEKDLIHAITKKLLSYAYLDVFRQEPLPTNNELWEHSKIIITCHSSSYISPEAGPKIIAKNIEAFDKGENIAPLYNREQGY